MTTTISISPVSCLALGRALFRNGCIPYLSRYMGMCLRTFIEIVFPFVLLYAPLGVIKVGKDKVNLNEKLRPID
jgi:hypothetical protein